MMTNKKNSSENSSLQISPLIKSNNSTISNLTNPELRGNFILRQELRSYTPECNAKFGIIFNFTLMLIFLAVGVPIIESSNECLEYSFPYTNCTVGQGNLCSISFSLNITLKAPVFLYYELDNFYLNHKNIVRSKVWDQLKGKVENNPSYNAKCVGAENISEMFDNDTSKYQTYTGLPLNGDDIANPCGLIAKSMFNDTFRINSSIGNDVFLNETGIANTYAKNEYYKRAINSESIQWIDVENEHFIVWMDMETFPSFRKLWGRIDSDLVNDTYTIIIEDNFNANYYHANKTIIIATSSSLGSSPFYGYVLIIAASYCLFVIFILVTLYLTTSEKKFDYSSIKWN